METQTINYTTTSWPAMPELKGFIISEHEHITHCLADGSYTWIYFSDRKPLIYARRLCQVHALVGFEHFLRCNNSCLVNINYIKEMSGKEQPQIVLANGTSVKISIRKKKDVKCFLHEKKMSAVA
jgi:two-component system LytT family response regulator